ncbi:endonuclease/exonuclease/phosphatase family protein [Wohlfahrtiimonas larvae]|uniref:Endonuclease/exonuclease/phosphatase domain-containing protein n=1 Tax=Wohlfahrtiimonas larvae TaxID=1157986 RepID=A0ABP9MDY5_9GAMM|nr:endonuclease/exonuclease/phosphatase family protein [Wohlfahrtiimonas larvae]
MIELRIATINAANLGEWSDAQRIQKFARSIVEDLKAPSVIAVQELGGLQKENELTIRATVADDICKILLEEFQQVYHYAEIAPKPESSGGAENINIRCGFFYRAEIKLQQLAQIGQDSEAFLGDGSGEFAASRIPLWAIFQYDDVSFQVINCHLKSMSTKDQTKKQAKKQRNRQSQLIADYIQENNLLDFPLFVVGDMNDTFASKTLQSLALQGLKSSHLSLQYQIYTYKYHKKPILLDYILYNDYIKNLESTIVHINTDQNSDRAYSDHDPLVMLCQICSE